MVIIKTGREGFLEPYGWAYNTQEARNFLYAHGYRVIDDRYYDNDGFEAIIEHIPYIWDSEEDM